jgi:hypothetical protein
VFDIGAPFHTRGREQYGEMRVHDPITILGETDYRNEHKRFGIKQADRRSHMYVIGKTGTGKSTLLETMICQDMAQGHGLALLDPHGDLIEKVLLTVPENRVRDVIYFNVPDRKNVLRFNPLAHVPAEQQSVAASGLLEAFKKIWIDWWGPRLEHILRNALLLLLAVPDSTLVDVLRLFDDESFRKRVAPKAGSPLVRRFWLKEYDAYPPRFRMEATAPIRNKVGAFLSDPRLFAIFSAPVGDFQMRAVMDEQKILLVNLAKGRIGEDTAALLGALLVSTIGVAGLSRAELREDQRKDFYVYLDEFQAFATLSLANMLSELRKYRVNLILAHQYLHQLELDLRHAILGNVGTLVSFRVGTLDAQILEKEFGPIFAAQDLALLPNYHMTVKLLVNSGPVRPFSAKSILFDLRR